MFHLLKNRKRLMHISELIEVFISLLLLIAIAIFSVNIVIDIAHIVMAFFTTDDSFFVEDLLGRSLELIIAIEFVKMILNDTPGSTIEVLIFAIAKTIIVGYTQNNHTPLLEILFGVIAIACLFGIRKWAHKMDKSITDVSKENMEKSPPKPFVKEVTLQGGTPMGTICQWFGLNISVEDTDTVGRYIQQQFLEKKGVVKEGSCLRFGQVRFIVRKMAGAQIEDVMIITEEPQVEIEEINPLSVVQSETVGQNF